MKHISRFYELDYHFHITFPKTITICNTQIDHIWTNELTQWCIMDQHIPIKQIINPLHI
jgi:hypothetical protein